MGPITELVLILTILEGSIIMGFSGSSISGSTIFSFEQVINKRLLMMNRRESKLVLVNMNIEVIFILNVFIA